MILAAGYATRLYPLTKDKPKPLIKVAGKPMMEHVLFRIEEIDAVDEIFVVTNDKFFPHFKEWASSYKTNKRIKIINDQTTSNENRLGAVGDIHFVINQESIKDDLLVVAGDNLFEFSLDHMHAFFQDKTNSVVALFDIREKGKAAKKYGIIETDEASKIIGFEEKPEQPKTSLVSTACYMFTKDDVAEFEKCMTEQDKPDNLGDFIKYLSEKKHVFGYVFSERWFDIGDHNQLQQAQEQWRQQ